MTSHHDAAFVPESTAARARAPRLDECGRERWKGGQVVACGVGAVPRGFVGGADLARSVPALSQRIKKLEAQAGTRLVERSPVVLTAAGASLLPMATAPRS